MQTLNLLFTFLYLSTFSIASMATELPNLKMTLTLVNQSNETLSYAGFTNTNPENIFLVSPKVIMPGATVTITAVSGDLNFTDLSADIHFADSFGKDHLFHVNDPQQIHYGHRSQDKSMASLTNDRPAPLALTYRSLS